jgi:mannose-6-phosphate isomerase-like protein (cupin superfamily)
MLRHGVEVEYYAPRGADVQTPHDRDELYVVAIGSGSIVTPEGERHCAAGDMIFVPARTVHRFEKFSDDFATWVVFFGPPQ